MQESLHKQQESIQKQADSLRAQLGTNAPLDHEAIWITPTEVFYPQANCEPLPASQVNALIQTAAKKNSVPAGILHAVMRQESAFRPCAISVKGAEGLMQLMPETSGRFHVTDPFDAEQSVQAGAAFLKQLLDKYKGDLRSALIAYNAGETRADPKFAGLLPLETQGYLANIFGDLGIEETEGAVHAQNPKPDQLAGPAPQADAAPEPADSEQPSPGNR